MREEQRDPKTLRPGDPHYSAYVGPPGPYDFTGATQFSLLFTLGLRAHHRVLDFGCGSLRAGRLLLPYLDPGNYFGVEPNRWLIDDAIRNEIGEDLVRIKRPTFDHNDRFRADCFDVQFDFIVAQSVFSHAGPEVVARSLRSFKRTVRPDGLIAATFVEGDRDYRGDAQYPKLVTYTRRTIKQLAAETELALLRIPWFHPRQTWYLLAADNARLPPKGTLRFLRGTPMSTATDDEEAPMGKGRQKPRSRSASEPSDPAMRTGGKRPKDQVQAQPTGTEGPWVVFGRSWASSKSAT